jgi:hypothetical protein
MSVKWVPLIFLCWVAYLTAFQNRQIAPPHPESVRVPLEIGTTHGDSGHQWATSAAWLAGNFQSTWAMLMIGNNAKQSFTAARFYAEYYDNQGRRCFTAIFSQDNNQGNIRGPFSPGETRTLWASSSQAPAARPTKIEIFVLGDSAALEPLTADVQAPPTVQNGVAMRGIDVRDGAKEPLLPFALVQTTVSAEGRSSSSSVINAVDKSSATWSLELASKARFARATRGEQAVGGIETLLLLQLLNVNPQRNMPAAVAWENPWVQSYVASKKNASALPFVQLLRLEKEQQTGQYGYVDLGTDWCLQIIHWVPNSSGSGFHRAWVPQLSQ